MNQTPTQVRVATTTKLGPDTPYLVIRGGGLPWTVILVREGVPYSATAPLWKDGRLTADELEAWLTPWGIPVDANPWDYVDPDRLAASADIPLPLRLPSTMEERILAAV